MAVIIKPDGMNPNIGKKALTNAKTQLKTIKLVFFTNFVVNCDSIIAITSAIPRTILKTTVSLKNSFFHIFHLKFFVFYTPPKRRERC